MNAAQQTPTALGRYRLVRRLGSGAMGTVYEAFDPKLRRRLAIKILHPPWRPSGGDHSDDSLLEEARALGRLSHPAVVTVTDVGVEGGQTFVAMEFVDGGTLRSWTGARPIGMSGRTRDLTRFALQAAEGLHAAHAAGLIHRDVKPANLLIDTSGRLRLADFGLAAPVPTLRSSEPTTQEGPYRAPVGTPAYMAPEQFWGDADERSDQFGWAASFYEAFSGARPYAGDSPHALVLTFERGEAPEPMILPGLPRTVGDVLVRALSVDPRNRYPSMGAAADALRGTARGRRRWTVGAVVVGGSVTAVGLASRPSPRACRAEHFTIEDTWSPARAEALQASLERAAPFGAQSWRNVEPKLDEFTRRWTRARVEVCTENRSGDRSPEAAARTVGCLDDVRDALDHAIASLLEADLETASRALQILDEIPPPGACREESALRRGGQAATDPRLAIISIALVAGDYETAESNIEHVLADARTDRHRGNEAAALRRRAHLQLERQQPGDATDDLRSAFFMASASGDDVLALDAALQLAFVYGEKIRDIPEANRWIAHAEVAATRKGETAGDTARIEARRGVIAQRDGRLRKAASHARRSATLLTEELGADAAAVASAHVNLSNALREQGKYDEAERSLRVALESHTRRLGAKHPITVSTVGAICELRGVSHRPDTALEVCAEYLAFAQETYPSGHVKVGVALVGNALAQSRHGQLSTAIDNYRAGLSILEAHYPATHPRVAQTQQNLAIVLLEEGEFDEAIALFHRGLESQREVLGRDHVDVAIAMVNLAGAYVEAADGHNAERLLREANAILETRLAPGTRPRVIGRGMLVRVLLDAGQSGEAMELLGPLVAGLEDDALDGETDGWIHLLYGRALLAQGDRSGAMQQAVVARSLLEAGADSAPSIREELAAFTERLGDGA